jgi:hypothetical protein
MGRGCRFLGQLVELYDDELNNLFVPNSVKLIQQRGMGWAGHVSCMRDTGSYDV